MKIGIGIPCHKNDIEVAEKYVLPSISRLNPPPHKVFIYVNECGLKKARTHIFDKLLIEGDCNVVLQACTDYYFFPNILSHVRPDKVVTFSAMTTTPIVSLSMIIGRSLARNPWGGCYSIPKHMWKVIRESPEWNGTDSSVQRQLNGDYYFTRIPNYILRRISKNIKKAVFSPEWTKRGIHQRGLKLIQDLKI